MKFVERENFKYFKILYLHSVCYVCVCFPCESKIEGELY